MLITWPVTALMLFAFCRTSTAQSLSTPPVQILGSQAPQSVSGQSARFIGMLPEEQKIQLSIVLPLRNQVQLSQLLTSLYDPSSSEYHKFLTVDEFTAQFGPSDDDYQEVVDFAVANGFTVTGQAKNKLVVPIEGTVAQVNHAFNVQLREYQHPTEDRTFFSPDRAPSVALNAQIADIAGINSFYLPHPMSLIIPSTAQPLAAVNGSGPGGSYLGSDMRAAYYGGSILTGLNQTVALVEFGGYLKSDVDLNFSGAGQTYNVPLQNVLVGTATNTVYQQDGEQVLDIVQAIGMAPGLSAVEVYIGDPTTSSSSIAVLNQIANDNTAKQISCSWGWIPGSIASQEAILQEMAAQGQTFFAASGDDGAFQYSISPFFYPGESQFVTAVGGTHLTTASAGGAWSSEVAWNSGGHGSGGGISPDSIPIPSWQSGLATSTNGGSNTLRNVPDVAMEGDFDNYVCNLGICSTGGAGTSFAAPRWAGFMALVNQQAVEAGNAPLGGVGFINAALSQIGTGTNYGTDFHDIQSGNNDTANQTVWFSAVPGYDLVTGWGSAAGQPLIDALAGNAVPGFWISSSTGTVSVIEGANATATISIVDAGGFSGNVSLAVTSTLPNGVTASFSLASTSGTSVLTLTASNAATQGTYPITISGTSGTITETTTINVAVHGPSFTLSASPAGLTVNQGNSATSTITVNDLYGFTGSVNLQVSGLPSGLTASFATNPTSTTSVLTLQASSTAANWHGYITVTGTSGSLTASTPIYVNLVAPTFTMVTPTTISMGQGTTYSSYVDITPQNGFTGNVTLSVSGLPSGVTAFLTPNPVSSSGQITFVTSSSAAVGTATVTITGTSGSITATSTIALTVNAPGFTLSGGGSISLGQGASTTTYIFVNDQYGFNGSVTLSASGLPVGVTASFSTNPTTFSSQMTLSASSSAVPGTYTVTVTGTGGPVTASTTIALTIGTPTFTVSAPTSVSLSQSGSISNFIYINSQYGFNGNVTFSASGVPAGVSASFSTNPTTYSTNFVLTSTAAAAPGNYTVTITGTSGSITKSTTMTLTVVTASFTISSASTVTLGIGETVTTYAYVYPANGYSGSVTLSVTGLPSGITASFATNPVNLSGYASSSLLTLTASGSVTAGSYTATLTGTSGSVTASTSITITVAAPSFTLSGGGSLTIGQGSSGSSYISVNAVNGFSGNVTLSVSGLPTGVTAAFGTNPTTYSSLLTFSATSTAPTGTYAVTVTGTSGSVTATTTISLTVAAPSFTLSASPNAYSVNQGATTSGYLYVSGSNGFSGSVSLTASGLPSGVTVTFGSNPTSYSTPMTISANGTATLGTSTITITATYGTTTASATFQLTVTAPSFTLMAAPDNVTLSQGGTEKSTVAVVAANGFTGAVTFSTTGLPSGVTASWNPASATTASVLTLTASNSATTGTTMATITGTSGTLTATAPLPITIGSTAGASSTALAISASGSSVTSTTWGTLVTLTATVTAGGSPVTSGLVNFCDSTASYCGDIHLLGAAQLNSNGVASVKLLPLPGTHSYQAVFMGTKANSASTSPSASLQVTGTYSTTTSIASTGTVGNYTLNATVAGAGAQSPTGNVAFIDTSNGNSTIASASLAAGTPALTWSQLSTTPTGSSPGAIVTGDLNGDGITDVAVLDTNYNAVTILLGNANGTFTISNLSPQTSSGPVALATADFNGDGIPDLAVVTSGGVVNILLGNGDGSFNAGANVTTGATGAGIVSGDFNGDGVPDLAVSDSANNRLVILLGKGDGTFTAQSSYPATGISPRAMAVADFNGDGWLDIAVGNQGSGSASVLLGNGDGTFSSAPALQAGNTPTALVVADFNRDGKPDLAVASMYSTTLSVYIGNGDGTFAAASSPTVNYYSNSMVPIDVNGDGILDLFVGSSYNSTSSVLLGKGDGTFTQGNSVTLPSSLSGAAVAKVTSSGFPGVISVYSSLNEVITLEPYVAQSATASATGISMGATGSHKVAASYPGDSNFAASQSQTVTIDGTKNDSIISWTAPASIVYGTALGVTQLNATANVPGTFAYTPAAGAVLGAGTQTLSVTFTPNDTTNYTTVTSTVQLVVNKASLTVTANNASMAHGSTLPTLSGSLTGVVSGDGITASYSTTATSSSAAGSYPITATLNDPNGKLGNYVVTNTSGTLTIGQATPAITWASPGAITYGTALGATQLNATSTVAGAFSYSPAAGTVLTAGSHTITATFTPTDTADYTTATATVTLLVSQASPAITWASPGAITYGTALGATQLNATSTVAGAFSYSPAAGTVLTAGSHTITTTFTPIDATDYTSPTTSVILTVIPATPGIALASSANPVFLSNPVTITATLSAPSGASSASASPSGSVAFYDGTTQLGTATISAGSALYSSSTLTAGTHAITAVYAGDINYATATSGAISEAVDNFTVTLSGGGSSSVTVSPGGQAVYTLVLSPPNGATFPAAINLSVTGLPTGATATFSPTTIPAGAGTTTVTLTVNVPLTAANQIPRQPFGQGPWPIALGLIFLPCVVMRRKHLQRFSSATWLLLLAIAGVASMATFIGCGGHSGSGSGSGSSPQTYTLTVTATSGALSNSTNLTLTVE